MTATRPRRRSGLGLLSLKHFSIACRPRCNDAFAVRLAWKQMTRVIAPRTPRVTRSHWWVGFDIGHDAARVGPEYGVACHRSSRRQAAERVCMGLANGRRG